MKTLIVGCDASGKSTLLEGIKNTWGDDGEESTHSEEASRFRLANYGQPVTPEYINQREKLYLKLSRQALLAFNTHKDIVTTDSSLVTRVSHSTMRDIVLEPSLTNQEIISAWQLDEASTKTKSPDLFVLTYADPTIVHRRIEIRQKNGNKFERFWGFNSPTFLDAYQQRWKSIIHDLSQLSFRCLSLDTGTVPIHECLDRYNQIRNQIKQRGINEFHGSSDKD